MKVVFLGKYNQNEVLTGPEKVAKRIFYQHTLLNHSYFLEYFFDGNQYSYFKKLFGKESSGKVNNGIILKTGFISLFFLLLKIKPEIVHIITFERFAVVALLYKLFSKVKFVYNVHGVIIQENKVRKNIGSFYKLKDKIAEFLYLKFSDKIIVYSDESLKVLEKYYNIKKDRVVLSSNGIDDIFYQKGKALKDNSKEILDIVFVGDTTLDYKGFPDLIKGIEQLSYPVKFHIVDDKSNQKYCSFKNDIISVFFYNKMITAEFADFLMEKDVFLVPSVFETFCTSAAEASAAGLIPVLSKETGFSRYIIDGENGFIINFKDSSALKNLLNLLNENLTVRKTISENARNLYHKLSWRKIYEQIFKDVYLSF